MDKKIIASIVLVVALSVGGYFFFTGKTYQSDSKADSANILKEPEFDSPTIEVEGEGDVDNSEYSFQEIVKHDSPEDCWLVLSGSVYDVSPFVAQSAHPGGESILQGCGTDATQLFEARPMGSGTPHSPSARGLLDKYYLGKLAD